MGGRIPESEIETVRSRSDLVSIAAERMSLKRAGRRFQGLCPFHDEKTPSFSINPESGLFYCFGCGESGNVFQFLMKLDGLTFVEAVETLARRAGVTLTFTDESPDERRRREARPRLHELLAAAAAWFHQRLLTGGDAADARRLLASRGYGRETADRFELGYAPAGWDETIKAMKAKGFLTDELAQAGLTTVSSRGGHVDLLRDRVVFPIFDAQGNPVAFAGRRIGDGDGPKYLNSPESTLYHKSSVLYGLNWARAAMVAAGTAVVVEGYTDVIGFHLAGASHAVATCGTALGEEHLRILKRYVETLVLAFDGDAAGAAATERTFGAASELGLDVRVAVLPAGRDPADVASEGEDAVQELLRTPRPLLEFKIDREIARSRLDSSEGEARTVEVVAAAIAQHPDPLVRTAVVRRTLRRLRDVTEDQLVKAVEAARRGAGRAGQSTMRPDAARGPGQARLPRVEEHALAALVQSPQEFLDAVPDFSPDWFASAVPREVAQAVAAVAGTAGSGPVDVTRLGLEEEAGALARRAAVLDPPGVDDGALHARETAHALERRWLDRQVKELQARLETSEADGDWADVKALDARLVAFIDRRQALGDA